ncbi:MAG: CaiB/BaiF CoA transferase family protein [Betaproteobacteria bacterium]|jgi:crotonobetainyl-CoA:carnitine CoA-transferase CaiB-like acyl-CoA transferase|nr:CoA transferase [Betaproteobacteria bacterium]
MAGPLAGVTVVDLTTVVMGPYATQILGDLGAEVIKVEAPGGDNVRHVGPMRNRGMGHMFMHLNRNKKSVVLDLKKNAGRDALLRIAAKADVLIYNIRPQAMQRLRLGYGDVAAANPRIIYVGAYGYGQTGPYAARPAYDDLIQGMTGLPWLLQQSGAAEPRYIPATLADRIVGLHAAYAVTTALYEREKSGKGQAVEVPMFECMSQMILGDHFAGRGFEPPLGGPGYARVLAPERRPFRTRDSYVCVLMYNDKQWEAFFRLIGREDLFRDDPRFNSHENRSARIAEANAFVAGEMLKRSTGEWLQALAEADIPCAPMNSIDAVIDDPHLNASGFIRSERHPSEGGLRTTAAATQWSRTPPSPQRPTPRLGENGPGVLRAAGYSDEDIRALAADGVTRLPD